MKYTLLKKWHPSQVEEVGHVFEEDESCNVHWNLKNNEERLAFPPEIALLCEAGFLEKVEDEDTDECHCWDTEKTGKLPKEDEHGFCSHGVRVSNKEIQKLRDDSQLELWTTEPPEGTEYWSVTKDKKCVWSFWANFYSDTFNLRTKNCHKTQKSAEEALKRLLEN